MTQEADELLEELDSGKAKTIPWEEVRNRVTEKLKR
jgi:hypothetical protein